MVTEARAFLDLISYIHTYDSMYDKCMYGYCTCTGVKACKASQSAQRGGEMWLVKKKGKKRKEKKFSAAWRFDKKNMYHTLHYSTLHT